ncbi:MAG: hypothetical protein ACM3SX_10180 [Deltaproteobacteria bacterium]
MMAGVVPRLIVNSFKHGKLARGWTWLLKATDLSTPLAGLVELDAFLDLSFWQQQAHDKSERDVRLDERRFRVLELRTTLEPEGLNRPREMPDDVALLITAWVFPVLVSALPATARDSARGALNDALDGHRLTGDRFETDVEVLGASRVRTEVRRWQGQRPAAPERRDRAFVAR